MAVFMVQETQITNKVKVGSTNYGSPHLTAFPTPGLPVFTFPAVKKLKQHFGFQMLQLLFTHSL